MADSAVNDALSEKRPVTIQMEIDLLMDLDILRGEIQKSLTQGKAITRADVIRLALRRLLLALYVHQTELPNPPPDLLGSWSGVVSDMHMDRTCPAWLFPGEGEQFPDTKPARKASGKKGKAK